GGRGVSTRSRRLTGVHGLSGHPPRAGGVRLLGGALVTKEILEGVKAVEKEKGIEEGTLLSAIEDALLAAYRKMPDARHPVRVDIARDSGDYTVWSVVPEAWEAYLEAHPHHVEAAEAARAAEQDDNRYAFVDLGRMEAILPGSEKVPGERYEQGSRIKAVIIEVRSEGKGPQVVLSRRSDELIRGLFELEVPEIADGLVVIRAVAREPGYRAKIAVESRVQGVDPVGACVGPRGSRVRMVVSELRGEKIDIIPWNTEPARFVAKALSPARVREVYIDDETREATVVVPDGELALAIGKA